MIYDHLHWGIYVWVGYKIQIKIFINFYGHLDEVAPYYEHGPDDPATFDRVIQKPIDPKNHFSLNPDAPVERTTI